MSQSAIGSLLAAVVLKRVPYTTSPSKSPVATVISFKDSTNTCSAAARGGAAIQVWGSLSPDAAAILLSCEIKSLVRTVPQLKLEKEEIGQQRNIFPVYLKETFCFIKNDF